MKSAIVLDCSTAIAWLNHKHITGAQFKYATSALQATQKKAFFVVPRLWLYEVSNVLVTLVRNKIISKAESIEFTSLLNSLPIQVIEDLHFDGLDFRVEFALENKLSAYDTAYLHLAKSFPGKLVTLDSKLQRIAKKLASLFEI